MRFALIGIVCNHRAPILGLDFRVRCCQAAVCMRIPLCANPALEVNNLVQWVIRDGNACSMQRLPLVCYFGESSSLEHTDTPETWPAER